MFAEQSPRYLRTPLLIYQKLQGDGFDNAISRNVFYSLETFRRVAVTCCLAQ